MTDFGSEQRQFRRYLDQIRGSRFAIYGVGKRAEALLPLLDGVQVVGFLDRDRTDGTFHQWPVLDLHDLPRLSVQSVFIAAGIAFQEIIFDRIGTFCREHHIALHGFGTDQALDAIYMQGFFRDTERARLTKEDLIREIDRHEVISFDCFDTLLMRRTLEPADVFGVVEARARKRGFELLSFPVHRRRAELSALEHGDHTPCGIYRRLQEMYGWTNDMREEIMQMELAVERAVLLPREEMAACLAYACRQGKRVYVISDMYLSAKTLDALLREHEISGYQKIFVSTEYGCGKTDGLFEAFRSEVHGASYLHIGDHRIADGAAARLAGIDAFVIRSALELFRSSRHHALERVAGTLNDRLLLGLILSRVANDPFCLQADGTFRMKDFGMFAYALFAPVLTAFLAWLLRVCREVPCEAVLFAARDGYLIQKMYDQFAVRQQGKRLPPSIYFYTSRKAAMKSGIHDEETLQETEAQFGSAFVRQVFGVDASEDDWHAMVFHAAKDAQEHFDQYLLRLSISKKKSYVFYDFCSQGTTQYFLEKSGMRGLHGCYFQYYAGARNFHSVRVCSYDKALEMATNPFVSACLVFEVVASSPEYSLEEFTSEGTPIFSDTFCWKNDWSLICEGQRNILQFSDVYLGELYDDAQSISKGFIQCLASLLPEHYADIREALEKLRIGDTVTGKLFPVWRQ